MRLTVFVRVNMNVIILLALLLHRGEQIDFSTVLGFN